MPTKLNWDRVDEASFESFPASDPPAWGSSHAAASITTAVPAELEMGSFRRNRPLIAAVAIGTAAAIVGGIFLIRHLRA